MKKILVAILFACTVSTASAGSWTLEKQEDNGSGVTYYLMCRPGGMTIMTGNPQYNQYWDSNGRMHSSFNDAANASCN